VAVTIVAELVPGVRSGSQELVILVDAYHGTGGWGVRFAVQDQPALRRDRAMTSMRVHLPIDMIPVDRRSLDRLVVASDQNALPAWVVDAVTSHMAADLDSSSDRAARFSREASWAALVGSAAEALSARRASIAVVERARRRQFAHIVDQHSGDAALTPDSLAAALGVSRRTLYVLAEPLGGVAEYLRGVRAWRAIERLQDPDDTSILASIARLTGFSSLRRMTRAVQSEIGVTPTALRAEVLR
jgi:AraC-like DNA-binding protein